MSASITTTRGHRVATEAFLDADRYYCVDQAFRDKLITDNRAQAGQLIWYVPLQKVMFLQTLVSQDPANSIWTELGSSNDYYKGRHASQSALFAAIPVGQDGWEAIIDTATQDAYLMLWDVDDAKWVRSGSNVMGITAQQASDIESNNAHRVDDQIHVTLLEKNGWNLKEESGENRAVISSENIQSTSHNHMLCIESVDVILTFQDFAGFPNYFRMGIDVPNGYSCRISVGPSITLEDRTGNLGVITQDNQRAMYRLNNRLIMY